MVTRPVTHDCSLTLGELKQLFLDDHMHMALLVAGRRLVAAVERDDLDRALPDDTPARIVGSLEGRVVHPDARLVAVHRSMRRARRRRLAVTDERGQLQGLLCLKASAVGFCSDDDVEGRQRDARARAG
jgi:CBS domain containing-hemolysin-like protein